MEFQQGFEIHIRKSIAIGRKKTLFPVQEAFDGFDSTTCIRVKARVCQFDIPILFVGKSVISVGANDLQAEVF